MTLRSVFWLVILFFLAACLATFGNFKAGQVVFFYPPHLITMSLMAFVVTFLIVFFLLYMLIRFLRIIALTPKKASALRQRYRQNKANQALLDSINHMFAGRFLKAEKSIQAAMQEKNNFSAANLLAAMTANEMKQFEQRDQYLNQVVDPDWRDARYMAEAFMSVDHHPEQALVALKELEGAKQQRVQAQKIALRAQLQLNNWSEAAKIIKVLDKHDTLDSTMQVKLRRQVAKHLLKEQRSNRSGLTDVWQHLSSQDQSDPLLVNLVARLLIEAGDQEHARKILVKSLTNEWNPQLLKHYPEAISSDDVLSAIQQAENWRQKYPNDPDLLLTLARLCFKQSLWGKAESFCQDVLRFADSDQIKKSAYHLLAKLKDELGDEEKANQYYRQAVLIEK